MRIAVAGFMHESNTFSPLPTDRAAFQAQSLIYGPELIDRWRDAHHEMGGFIEASKEEGFEIVPIVMAWAMPSGPVTYDVFEEVTGRIISELKEHKSDGLLLALHGAMVAQAHPDADGDTVARLRRALGPDFPIVVTLDLHGNVSPRLIENCQVATAYRTYPHVDQRACGRRAANVLVRMVRGEIKPKQTLAKPRLIVNILAQETAREPMKALLAEAVALEKQPGIVSVDVLPGFAYADVPQMGPTVIVAADGDESRARREADRLAQRLWAVRDQLAPRLPNAEEAVRTALASTRTPVVLVDCGDNVGGGSAADGTVLLAELLRQQATDAVICLYAPNEVQECVRAGIGQTVSFHVGGKVDLLHGDPIPVNGCVMKIHNGAYTESEPRHGGLRHNNMGLTAVLELPGRNLLVLNSLRHPPFSLGQLTCLGIQPEKQRILVVKAAIAYKAAYAPVAGSIIEVDTPGLTAVNPERFKYQRIRRPMFPLDP